MCRRLKVNKRALARHGKFVAFSTSLSVAIETNLEKAYTLLIKENLSNIFVRLTVLFTGTKKEIVQEYEITPCFTNKLKLSFTVGL